MPYGIVISDSHKRLRGVWWIENETSVADVAMVDEFDHAMNEEQVYDISLNMDGGKLAPVQRQWEADPVKPDWLDVLVREARPTIGLLAKWVEGPFVTGTGNAADFLEWVQLHPELVAGLPTVDRTFVP